MGGRRGYGKFSHLPSRRWCLVRSDDGEIVSHTATVVLVWVPPFSVTPFKGGNGKLMPRQQGLSLSNKSKALGDHDKHMEAKKTDNEWGYFSSAMGILTSNSL